LLVLAILLAVAGYRGNRYLSARSHYRLAREAVDRHDWREADKHVKASLQRWPRSPDTYLLAARVARRLEHLDEANSYLETYQSLVGEETQSLKVERALLGLYKGDLASNESFLRACVKEDDPDTVEILEILSAALFLNYRVAEAHQCLNELLQRQPDHFDALVQRGRTARSMTWYAEAVKDYEKALALRPDADNVRLPMAEIQVFLGRFADAQGHFEQLRERQPHNPSVLFGLARAMAGNGQKEQAVSLLDQLLADHPNDWKMLGERGWLAVQLDRPAEGEKYLRRAVSLAEPDVPVLVHLSECLRLLGKNEESREYQEKADLLKAQFARAEELGDLIREKRPNDPDLRHELGCILLNLKNEAGALHWFQTALEKDPAHRPTHESLVKFYESKGDSQRAAHHRSFLQSANNKNGVSP
jgi:tetratricopeptide (TPR) repeat protein